MKKESLNMLISELALPQETIKKIENDGIETLREICSKTKTYLKKEIKLDSKEIKLIEIHLNLLGLELNTEYK